MADDGLRRLRRRHEDQPVHRLGLTPERARDLRVDYAGAARRWAVNDSASARARSVGEPDVRRMFEGPDPIRRRRSVFSPQALDAAHTPSSQAFLRSGDGLDAERGMKGPDLVESEAGDAPEEGPGRHALAQVVQGECSSAITPAIPRPMPAVR